MRDAVRFDVASHESGHAIVAVALGGEVESVEVFPAGGGVLRYSIADDSNLRGTVSVAGAVGQRLLGNGLALPALDRIDLEHAAMYAAKLGRPLGEMLPRWRATAMAILGGRYEAAAALAAALFEHGWAGPAQLPSVPLWTGGGIELLMLEWSRI